jgi:hypothetical protein
MGRFGGVLTDQEKEKIDRAAWHEQVQFLKNQQWAMTTAGVVFFGAFLGYCSTRVGPNYRKAPTRGGEILGLHKAILVASAAVVVWIVLFKSLQPALE